MNDLSTFITEHPLASFLVFLVGMQLAISLGKIGTTHKVVNNHFSKSDETENDEDFR